MRGRSANVIVGRAGLLVFFFGAGQAASPATLTAQRIDGKIDAVVRGELETQKVPGVAVGVVMNGSVIVAKGYGEANVEHHVPVSPQTIFQSGSIGKQFTAVVVMLEVEDGKLGLDDSVTKYLADAPPSWRPITIRHLLTHTSGIPTYSTDDIDNRRDYSEDEFLKVAYALPLEFEPGSRWSYSNTGYAVLGFLIHRVSGRFYGDILKDRVFQPLGMKTARVISEEDIVPNRAAGYRRVNGDLKNQDWIAPTLNTTADGSLYLSVDDYIAWDRGLRARAILRPDSWAAIYTPFTLKSGRQVPYGFGWDVELSRGQPWYHHNGQSQGFSTCISRHIADSLTVIVLTNLADASPSRIADGITRTIDPQLATMGPGAPIPDHEPAVAERIRATLPLASDGKLSRADLPAVRRDFFPEDPQYYRELLHPLGAPVRLDLLERRDWGDDILYYYAAVYERQALLVQMTLGPNGQIWTFDIEPR